jgi:hypothetical protein
MSELHHDQAVDEVHKEAHIVFNEQDGEAFVAKPIQKTGKILLFAVPKPGGRLIEQQEGGIGAQRACHFNQTLLTQRQAAGWPM